MPNDISYIVPGQAQPASPGAAVLGGRVTASVRVGARRGAGDSVHLTARPGEDMVVLSIEDGPTLVLHPESARDLMRAQTAASDMRGASSGAAADGTVAVPASLGWPGLEAGATRGATRGWMGQVLLSAVDIVNCPLMDHHVDIVGALATRKLDGRVEAGVYELSPNALQPLKGSGRKRDQVSAAADGGPFLVLIHGTFVDTASTFAKLWDLHPQVVARLFAHYGQRVFALDHPTVSQSPIANALTLVKAMPNGAKLHLLTHSRGGVVAEVLARACAGKLSDQDLALFADVANATEGPARNYAQHRADLKALVQQAQAKQLQVERVLRVACPARGTLLASKRLDAYLSVLRWGLQLAGLPVVPELLDFLGAVAQRRTDPCELPGLEAMTPDSPVVQWLNRGGEPIAGQLRVLAGDIEGDSLMSWVKTLLSDAFYWTDNDLVVQTRSMYGGAARVTAGTHAGASFVLERGAKVSHFNYFANERSVAAVLRGLTEDQPEDFRLIGPLSWAGQDAGGTRAALALVRSRGPSGDGVAAENRPAVIVLPGILGSNIALDGKRVWLGLRLIGGLKKLAWDPSTASRFTPDGPIGTVYDDLIEHLSATHEVIEFSYDWRRPVEDEARRLASVVDAALARRETSQQPVRLVAHSMGGLVSRTMQLESPDVWGRMMARPGARLLMLGTPNGGSWAPMQTLSGDDSFGNTLVAFGGLLDDAGTRAVMAAMPGFIQLQASLTDPALGLGLAATWQKLADDDLQRLRERSAWHDGADQLSVYRWSAPPQGVLDQAVALRRRLDAQAANLGADAQHMLLVVGHDKFTPAGFQLGDDGLEYLDAVDGGDGRVPLGSALLPGVRTWRCDVAHGKLPDEAAAFAAYVELLTSGDTLRLPRLEATGTRSAGTAGGAEIAAPALVPNRPSRGRRASEPPSLAGELFGRDMAQAEGAKATRLPLCVVNGNLKFIDQPLLLGHYMSGSLSGAEAVVNLLIGGAMAESLSAGLYPAGVGSQQVFANQRVVADEPLARPRPAAVVVIGLGEEGRLRLNELSLSVRQGVMAYAQRESEQRGGGATGFELAATVIGSGGVGIHVGGAAQAIAQGVASANQRLRRNGWPVASRLSLVELFLDRATEAHNALAVLAESRPTDFALAPAIQPGTGALRRPADSGYRGAAYDFITAVQHHDDKQRPMIEYTLDTQRARSEVRGQSTQVQLVDELVRVGANSDNRDTQIGRSLFQLLVPVEIEPFLSGAHSLVLQLDKHTARFPWELLDTGDAGLPEGHVREPWAVRTQVLRKLKTEEFREHPLAAGRQGGVLVIGEPACDKTRFAELPSARLEAQAVAKVLGAQALLGPDALQAVNALLAQPLRIVHIAGHGEHRDDGSGGVVLSNNTVLGACEIAAMRSVPELVFINCCFIGQIHPDPHVPRNALGAGRAQFAASVAEALICIGVRCVVAAGWAVEDGPAMHFASRFYERLLAGERFIDAVGAARRAAWEARPAGNTWAAYQCYGDPEWRYVPPDAAATPQAAAVPDVASAPALALVLENEALEARYADAPTRASRGRRLRLLSQLQARHAAEWGGIGAVAEAFGLAYAECGDIDTAIDWYRRALGANDGSASLKAAEQLCNQLARRAGASAGGDEAVAQARADIGEAIERLRHLVALHSTVEREQLLGSAFKRLAMIEQGPASVAALKSAVQHYANAEAMVRAGLGDDLYYPVMNGIAASLRIAVQQGVGATALDAARVEAARQGLQSRLSRSADFWSLAGPIEMRWLDAVSRKRLAAARADIEQAFADLAQRAPAPRMWASVHDQARFVLEPYAQKADGAERAAATALLKRLKALAA